MKRRGLFIVGEKNKVKSDMYKPLFEFCVRTRDNLQQEANKKGIKKRVPLVYAQVEILKRLKQ